MTLPHEYKDIEIPIPSPVFDYWMLRLRPFVFIMLIYICYKRIRHCKTAKAISKKELTKHFGRTQYTIEKAISELRDYNIIKKTYEEGEHGCQIDAYKLNMEKILEPTKGE